ncbi:MAG: rod shape-determining protein MreD [Caldilineaceae bacterium]|nr:rod shape-determining protein MreD [Caldilineaceae bacterium]MDE0339251.1 rod shape-determining protein MreD [Caldilineaceae bacterium]
MASEGHRIGPRGFSGGRRNRRSFFGSPGAQEDGLRQGVAGRAFSASFSSSSLGGSWLIVPILGAAAIFQVVVVPKSAVRGVYPDLILLLVIARSLIAGGRGAVSWAFVGGLWMDVLSGGAIGASSLALMATSLITGIGHNAIFRRNSFVPFVAALSGSLVFSLIYLTILVGVGYRFPLGPLVANLIVPATLYNGAVMFLATPVLNRLPEKANYP